MDQVLGSVLIFVQVSGSIVQGLSGNLFSFGLGV